MATATHTTDPSEVLAQLAALGSEAIRQRLDALEAEQAGLRVLLRAALARECRQRPTTSEVQRAS
ncbi:MAG: hypothetical protein JNM56_40735 [Planctomycetia bacterium]|nr:hypothetical protein [Planctomycetia bacterium]